MCRPAPFPMLVPETSDERTVERPGRGAAAGGTAMTTTTSIRVAGKPSAGPGGDGTGGHNGRFGLRAKLAAGVMILGCAAALALGVLRTEDAAQLQPQT